jgi:hypothetical protein
MEGFGVDLIWIKWIRRHSYDGWDLIPQGLPDGTQEQHLGHERGRADRPRRPGVAREKRRRFRGLGLSAP